MAAQVSSSSHDPVKQFSVFAENRLGRLHDLTALLKAHEVHVMAITVLDTTDSAIVRFVVDDPDLARELLVNNDFPYVENDVLAVEITDESQLSAVLAALFEAEINLHYIYSFIKRPEGRSALAMNVEDADVAAQALSQRGFRSLTQNEIARGNARAPRRCAAREDQASSLQVTSRPTPCRYAHGPVVGRARATQPLPLGYLLLVPSGGGVPPPAQPCTSTIRSASSS